MPLPSEVRFRATFLRGSTGSDAFFGSATDYVVSEGCFETPGNGHPRPYLYIPTNFFQSEVDFLRGSSRLGSITISVLDKRQEADDQATGIVTSEIATMTGSEVIVERYFDDIDEWKLIFRGSVQRYAVRTSDVVVYEFDCEDPRAYEEDDELFAENFTFCISPERGPTFDYGAFPSGDGFLLDAAGDGIGSINTQGPDADGIYYAVVGINEEVARDFELLGTLEYGTRTFRGVGVQWQYTDGSPADQSSWNLVKNSPAREGMTVAFLPPGDSSVSSSSLQSWRVYYASTNLADMPQVAGGSGIRTRVVAGLTTQDTPYFWDNGTLGDLLFEISTGVHTRAVPREKYDATAMADFRANSPQARFIETAPRPRRKWTEINVYQAALRGPAFTSSVDVAPVSWISPPSSETVPFLRRDSLRPPGEWIHASEDAVNTISGTYIEESIGDQRFTQEYKTKKFLGFIPTGVEQVDVNQNLSPFERLIELEVNFQIDDPVAVEAVGTRVLEYRPITLRTIGSIESRPVGGDTQDPAAVLQANRYIEEAKRRYLPYGAPRLTIDAKISDPIVRDVVPGQFLTIEVPWHPDYGTGRREAVRYMQVYGFRDNEIGWRTLYLEDAGQAAAQYQTQDETGGGNDPAADCVSSTGGTDVGPSIRNKTLIRFDSDDNLVLTGCPGPITVRFLAVAGGGGGGIAFPGGGGDAAAGGGGGAGGVVQVTRTIPNGTTIPITVGAGGVAGSNGESTVVWVAEDGTALDPMTDDPALGIQAAGGGAGGDGVDGSPSGGSVGGSGGGGGARSSGATSGAAGTVNQGNAGAGGFGDLFGPCFDAFAGGGGSFFGPGNPGGGGAAGLGGGAGTLAGWGIRLGGGGGGGSNLNASSEACPTSQSAGIVQGGYGAGGGGGGGVIPGTPGTAGVVFVEYIGARQSLAAPSFTFAQSSVDPEAGAFTIDEADWPDADQFILPGFRVRAEFAVFDTEPPADSGLWKQAGVFEDFGVITTPRVPSGSRVWARLIATATDIPPSDPSTSQSATIGAVPGLLDFFLVELDGVVTAFFTPNAFTSGVVFQSAIIDEGATSEPTLTDENSGDPVDAGAGSFVMAKQIGQGQSLRVSAQCFPIITGVDGNTPDINETWAGAADGNFDDSLFDDWTENEAAGADNEIQSERLVLDTGPGSGNNRVYATGVARDEVFVQVTANQQAGDAGVMLKWDDLAGDGYFFGFSAAGGFSNGGISRYASLGPAASLDEFTNDPDGAVDMTVQMYAADGVQQMRLSDGGGALDEFQADATDTTYDGSPGTVALYQPATNSTTQYDDILVTPSKFIAVSALPTGWQIAVENSGATEIATATESGGVAQVDVLVGGVVTELVPQAGWSAIVVKDDSGVEQYRYNEEGIYPGLNATWNTGTGSFDGVSGDPGRTYIETATRPVSTVLTPGDLGNALNAVFDDDLDFILTDDLSFVTDDDD